MESKIRPRTIISDMEHPKRGVLTFLSAAQRRLNGVLPPNATYGRISDGPVIGEKTLTKRHKSPLSTLSRHIKWIKVVLIVFIVSSLQQKVGAQSGKRPRRVATAIPPGADARINCILPKDTSVRPGNNIFTYCRTCAGTKTNGAAL